MDMQFFKSVQLIKNEVSLDEISKRSSLLELTQKINDLIEMLDDFNVTRGIRFLDIKRLNYLNNTLLACLTDFVHEDKEKLTTYLSKLLKQSSDMLLVAIQNVDNEFVKVKELMANIQRHSFKIHCEITPNKYNTFPMRNN